LPDSVTRYDAAGLSPIEGCCTRFDAPPPIRSAVIDGWEAYLDERPASAGVLEREWNAHPAGCRVFLGGEDLACDVVIVDRPPAG
jgi:sarcosine oxidase delta subunit